MVRSVASKIAWAARATTVVVGLAIMLALIVGVASAAFGANGDNFILGQPNRATAITQLTGNVSGGPALRVNNPNTADGSGGMQVTVAEGKAPMQVNATAGKATNLDADKLDGRDSTEFQSTNASAGGSLAGNYPDPHIANGVVSARHLGKLPAVRVSTSEQSIPKDKFTELAFTSEDFDQVGAGHRGEMHSTGSNSGRLRVPRDGIYHIDGQVMWGALPTKGHRTVWLYKNSGSSCQLSARTWVGDNRSGATAGNHAPFNHFSTLLALNQGDWLTVCVYQSSGGNLRVLPRATFASMHYVGPK